MFFLKRWLWFILGYIISMPSAYRDFKGIIMMRETIAKEGYCAPFLIEFEKHTNDIEGQRFIMHQFLMIVADKPSIMDEKEWPTILQYKKKIGM
jgi:hypothetical protein